MYFSFSIHFYFLYSKMKGIEWGVLRGELAMRKDLCATPVPQLAWIRRGSEMVEKNKIDIPRRVFEPNCQ